MNQQVATVGLKNSDCDYSTFTAFENSIPANDSSTLYIGILGVRDDIKLQLLEFMDHKYYKAIDTPFLLVTEAGDIIASHEENNWTVVHEYLDTAFNKEPIDISSVRVIVDNFLAKDETPEEGSAREAKLIVKTFAQEFAKLIARDSSALRHIEWRQLEQMLAEVFEGIGFIVELTPPSKDKGRDIILSCRIKGKLSTYVVEVKHWLQNRVGQGTIANFVKVILKEEREVGLLLSTYGFTKNAFEALTSVERKAIRFGKEEKIVSLCRTYVNQFGRLSIPEGLLPSILVSETL